jgi:hypothetical protein
MDPPEVRGDVHWKAFFAETKSENKLARWVKTHEARIYVVPRAAQQRKRKVSEYLHVIMYDAGVKARRVQAALNPTDSVAGASYADSDSSSSASGSASLDDSSVSDTDSGSQLETDRSTYSASD